jgi:hypothetical protein
MFVIAVGGSVLNVIGREEEEPPVFSAVTTKFSPNVKSGDIFLNVTDGVAVSEESI